MSASQLPPGNCQSGFLTKAAVGVLCAVERDACVRPSPHARQRIVAGGDDRVAADHEVGLAGADARRVDVGPAWSAICTWHITRAALLREAGRRPARATPLPSRCAAMPSSWPIVTTPVPPTPVDQRCRTAASVDGSAGSGTARRSASGRGRSAPLLRLLQLAAFDRDEARAEAVHARVVLVAGDWLIWRLRPNSVSSGSTDRQFDLHASSRRSLRTPAR